PVSTTLFVLRMWQSVIIQYLAEAVKIKSSVVCHYRLALYIRLDLFPYLGEGGRIAGVFCRQTVYFGVPMQVIIIWRTNQFAKFFSNNAFFYTHQSNLANAPTFALGRFKINSGKGVHSIGIYSFEADKIILFGLIIKFFLI